MAIFLFIMFWNKSKVWGGVAAVCVIVIPVVYVYCATINAIAFWITTILISVACAILAGWARTAVVSVSTSLIGAYITVRGISLFIGGFPNEKEIYNQIKNGDFSLPTTVKYYTGLIMIIAVLYFVAQSFLFKERGEADLGKNGESQDASDKTSKLDDVEESGKVEEIGKVEG